MLNNKKVNIVLSVIVAICLWAYVIGEINPVTEKTLRNIPITFENEDVLEDNELAVLSTSDETVNVTVSGTRTSASEVNENNVTAVVDLSQAAKGSNELKIEFRVPDKVEVTDSNLNKVTVTTEALKTKEVDVKVTYEGTFDTDKEPVTLNTDVDTVTVRGATTLVDSVNHVNALVAENSVTDKSKNVEAKLFPADRSDKTVKRVKTDRDTVTVECELGMTKTVKLEVPVTDNSDDGMTRDVTTPETIVIKGSSDAITAVNSITAEPIDVSDIVKDTAVEVVPILPEGVQLSDKSEKPAVTVKVTESGDTSKTVYFSEADIETSGLGEGLNAVLQSGSIAVTVSGTRANLDAISKADIKLSVDLSNMEAGTRQVDIKAACAKTHSKLTVNPDKIEVTIE